MGTWILSLIEFRSTERREVILVEEDRRRYIMKASAFFIKGIICGLRRDLNTGTVLHPSGDHTETTEVVVDRGCLDSRAEFLMCQKRSYSHKSLQEDNETARIFDEKK